MKPPTFSSECRSTRNREGVVGCHPSNRSPHPPGQRISYHAPTVRYRCHGIPALTQAGYLPLEFPGQPLIVAIQEGDKLTVRHLNPGITGAPSPAVVGKAYHSETRILEFGHDLLGLIRETVVHDDALQIGEGLGEYARDGTRQERGSIVAGDHNADQRGTRLFHLTCRSDWYTPDDISQYGNPRSNEQ